MHWCYILYSPTIDKFYIGETEDLELRIAQQKDEKQKFILNLKDSLELQVNIINRFKIRI